MATTTRKSTTAKPAAKRTPAKKATPAKKSTPAPKVKKSDVPEHLRDYTYLADKEPTALHDDFADWMIDVIGLDFESDEERTAFVKGVQVAAVLRGVYQRSPRNKSRSDYRPLAGEVVEQRSIHMVAAHQDARRLIEAKPAPKATATRKAPAKKATPARRVAKKA